MCITIVPVYICMGVCKHILSMCVVGMDECVSGHTYFVQWFTHSFLTV